MLNTQFSSVFSDSSIEKVFIYSGDVDHKGVYWEGVDKIKAIFSRLKCPWPIVEVTQEEFSSLELIPFKTLFIVPGAKASDLDVQLGSQIKKIREFVENGGYHLGICGGAYWSSKRTSYTLGPGNKIEKTRELAFFEGFSKGPLRSHKFGNEGESRLEHGSVCLKWRSISSPFRAFIMGGGSFVSPHSDSQCEVLAEYLDVPEEEKNAVVKCYVGKGISILAGPHLEYLSKDVFNYSSDHDWKWIKDSLEETDDLRILCFSELLKEFSKEDLSS